MDMEKYMIKKKKYFFGFYTNNVPNGFFMSYNTKNGKILIGFNNHGKVDGIAKYFRQKMEGKLIILKNRQKEMEIQEEDKIINYLNDKNNYDDKIIEQSYIKYFYMKREELEKILIDKCNKINISEINELLDNIIIEYT